MDTEADASATADKRVQPKLRQDPLLAAVDLANQTRLLHTGTGVCAGCTRPGDLYREPEEPGREFRPSEPIR